MARTSLGAVADKLTARQIAEAADVRTRWTELLRLRARFEREREKGRRVHTVMPEEVVAVIDAAILLHAADGPVRVEREAIAELDRRWAGKAVGDVTGVVSVWQEIAPENVRGLARALQTRLTARWRPDPRWQDVLRVLQGSPVRRLRKLGPQRVAMALLAAFASGGGSDRSVRRWATEAKLRGTRTTWWVEPPPPPRRAERRAKPHIA